MTLLNDLRTRVRRPFSDETRLCFAAAAGFCAIGGLGWIINRIYPGHNLLSALLAVGGFYLVLGVVSLFKKPPVADVEPASLRPDFLRNGGGSQEAAAAAPAPAHESMQSAA